VPRAPRVQLRHRRPDEREDRPLLTISNTRFAEKGYRLPDLLRAIALSAFVGVSMKSAASARPSRRIGAN
jgi:hypothetical protein